MAAGSERAWGVVCALEEELGSLRARASARRGVAGAELFELELAGRPVLAMVAGVGKVRAARAASLLVAAGATRGLFVVGVCGGLRRDLVPGTMVHCARAIQTDLAVRGDREVPADPGLRAAWRALVPGPEGAFLTADRPVLSLWRRARLARTFLGPCVADMETAAVGRVAALAGVPWAALRAVTDPATGAGLAAFKLNFPSQAGRGADTLPDLVARLERGS